MTGKDQSNDENSGAKPRKCQKNNKFVCSDKKKVSKKKKAGDLILQTISHLFEPLSFAECLCAERIFKNAKKKPHRNRLF